MDDQRIGAAFRAVRVRRGWRRSDVATRATVSASVVSAIDHGRLDQIAPATLRRVAAVPGIRAEMTVRLPHGEVDRPLNASHAALHEELARYLDTLPGWLHAPEVSFAVHGERGVVDILAYHQPTRSLLVIELKTELVALEDLLATMDRRLRLAARIARDRGWEASTVSGWVVFAESDTNRRRARSLGSVLRSAFPADGRTMRSWLQRPVGSIRALSFWANFGEGTTQQRRSTRQRVRVPRAA